MAEQFTVVVKFSPPTPWIYPVQEIFDAFEFVWDDFWKLSKKPLSNSGGKGIKLGNHGKMQNGLVLIRDETHHVVRIGVYIGIRGEKRWVFPPPTCFLTIYFFKHALHL